MRSRLSGVNGSSTYEVNSKSPGRWLGDGKPCLRIKPLDGLRHDMGGCMPESFFAFFIVERQKFDLGVFAKRRPEIAHAAPTRTARVFLASPGLMETATS